MNPNFSAAPSYSAPHPVPCMNEVDREVDNMNTAHEQTLQLIDQLHRRVEPVCRGLQKVGQSTVQQAESPRAVCHSSLASRLQAQANSAERINQALRALLEDVVL